MQLEVVTSHSSTNISMKEVKGVAKRTGLGKFILGKFAYIQTLCDCDMRACICDGMSLILAQMYTWTLTRTRTHKE